MVTILSRDPTVWRAAGGHTLAPELVPPKIPSRLANSPCGCKSILIGNLHDLIRQVNPANRRDETRADSLFYERRWYHHRTAHVPCPVPARCTGFWAVPV